MHLHRLQLQENVIKVKTTGSTQDNPKSKQICSKRPQGDIDQENVVPKKRYKKSERMPPRSIRFDLSLEHFPRIDKSRLVRCKNEGCENKKSYLYCQICNVHLCICIVEERNCFTDFHMIEKNDANLR